MNLACKLIFLIVFSILLCSCAEDMQQSQALIVCITFDDGFKDVYQTAQAILAKYEIPATCFVNTGTIGHAAFMSWEELGELNLVHGWEVGSHGASHANLAELSASEAAQEIEQDYLAFKAHGFSPQSFALPYGICPTAYYGLISKRFQNIRSSNDLPMYQPIDRQNLSYFPYHASWNAHIVNNRILKAMADKESLLILGFHQVGDGDEWQNCKPQILEEICKFIQERGLKTATISQAMNLL